MPELTLENLRKEYGSHVAAAGVSLTVQDGEFVSLLGPSGCGKTTILRMVAGLIAPTSGRILVQGRDITRLPTHRRNIGLVFQSYALFPHMTVFDNVAFGLRRQGVRGAELTRRVQQALDSVRLPEHGARYPRQLSGGQQQRVALARSIAPQPQLLLFDEPLSNLDAALRDEMQFELKRLQRELGITTLFVTHDQTEAMSLSDRVCVLAHGVVQQYDRPEVIYDQPATAFVARFIGRSNRLDARLGPLEGELQSLHLAGGLRLLAQAFARQDSTQPAVAVVVRQEDIRLLGEAVAHSYPARVLLRSFVGARVQYALQLQDGPELIAEVAASDPQARLQPGDSVHAHIRPEKIHVHAIEASDGAPGAGGQAPQGQT